MFKFVNIGATCYLNSGLQILFRAKALNDRMEKLDIVVSSPETEFLKEYDDLRRLALSSGECTVRPERFVRTCHALAKHKKNEVFSSLGQQDLCEFFHFVIDALHVAMCDKEDDPATMVQKLMRDEYQTPIAEAFFGVHAFAIMDGDILLKTTREPFFMLDLPIPKRDGEVTLAHCFEAATLFEEIDGYECDDGERKTVRRNLQVEKWPKNLVVSLKRFLPDGRKNDTHVAIPDNIYLAKPYVLTAVACHSGGARGGHYTATVRDGEGKWWCVDDDAAYPAPHFSKGGYCFMYSQAT
jgi:ubiquitin C-terminal hydrolase